MVAQTLSSWEELLDEFADRENILLLLPFPAVYIDWPLAKLRLCCSTAIRIPGVHFVSEFGLP